MVGSEGRGPCILGEALVEGVMEKHTGELEDM